MIGVGRLVIAFALVQVAGLGCSSASSSGSTPTPASGAQPAASGGRGASGAGTGAPDAAGPEAGAGAPTSSGCPAGTPTSITEIMTGTVPLGTQVALTGVVATSPKFLASLGATGTCYWGVFVSEPVPQAVPYSGGLVLNTGTNAVLEASGLYGACPTGTDLIPDDTAPGDVLSVTATLVSYVRADCATTTAPAPVPEVRINSACAVRRDATGHSVPAPATVPDVSELTNAAGDAIHRKWTGVLIKLDNVQGVDLPAGTPVGSTGSIQLTNGVRVRDRIYQPRTAVFGPSTTWSWIVGISHLDVCTWSIEPRDPCSDFSPRSQNCP